MTVKEFCEKKVQELQAAGCKSIKVGRVDEVKLGPGNTFTYSLFTAPVISGDTITEGEWDNRKECRGAQFHIECIKPRCRKPVRDYFYAALV